MECQHHGLCVRCAWRFLRCQHTEPARKDVQATGGRDQYSGSTTNPSVGRRGSVISRLLLTYTDGTRTNADSITELCRLGYPQSSPELRQELISEQFVRGQSDPELKKYLWVVIRTQKDRKLQTLIEVCTDFASLSLSHTANVHRPVEQVFALEEDDDREEEMFAVVDRQQWNTQRAAEPPLSPELQQMFTLARRMGYEM